ncbi:hypothetical protein H7J51_05340 [Mycobacterium crocinum]|uniref:Helix-turn-helix domain-containing protein n=1 Tax=Mycolicibacterium crocinum TaxID=388459 RepID=A0ABY3TKV9_9MYCO|nr:hypothetical protein [Mycolicibacterium crocinum]MCV7214708.1 hypothetical protein [Mycolicibacterium crocinum]ULN41605.1 hypothetical protein MI149_00100 [Mycolicibacterium crocinum]
MTHDVELSSALKCARLAVALYAGRTPPRWLLDHIDQLEHQSRRGCARETESVAGLEESNLIGTAEAARIIGCSQQYIRRIHADLDGHRIARNAWLFDKRKVVEYATHRNANHRQQVG